MSSVCPRVRLCVPCVSRLPPVSFTGSKTPIGEPGDTRSFHEISTADTRSFRYSAADSETMEGRPVWHFTVEWGGLERKSAQMPSLEIRNQPPSHIGTRAIGTRAIGTCNATVRSQSCRISASFSLSTAYSYSLSSAFIE